MQKDDEAYFREANRWDRDRELLIHASARRAWVVASIAIAMAVICGAAVALLTPLKRVEPFLVRVDSATGVTDVVPLYVGHAELPETVLRHLVTEYVSLRERYIPALAETDYEQVGAYQSASLNQLWATAWARTNADSPLNAFGEDGRVTAQIRAITVLSREPNGPAVLQVRLRRATQRTLGSEEAVDYQVATMKVEFSKPSADARTRALNPLGFKVVEYHRESELPEPQRASIPSAVSSGSAP